MATQLYIFTGVTSNSVVSPQCSGYLDVTDTYDFILYNDLGINIPAPIQIDLGVSGTTTSSFGGGTVNYNAYPTISLGNTTTYVNVDTTINNSNPPGCVCPCPDITTITDVYVITSDPNYIITLVSAPPVCTCTYVDVIITQHDVDSASGNTNPSQNGIVYYQYNTCDNPNPMVSQAYSVAGTYTNSVCVLTTQLAYTSFYYYQNDNLIDSITTPLDFTSSYMAAGCCVPSSPTPTQTPTQTPTPTITPTNTGTPTQTPTNTPTPTEPYDIYLFEECSNSSNQFRFENVAGVLTVGDVYNITGSYFNGYATVVNYSAVGPVYPGAGTTFIGAVSCPSPTPTPTISSTPTPTPTITSTPTVTPTITPSAGSCATTYCLRTSLPSLSGYSGNYTQTGTYNSMYYYDGDGIDFGTIYYTGDRWCLSTSLGGTCLLEGSNPCYSVCPDISANLFSSGICPTPTPSPANCNDFDFSAYFDCDWEPIPTPTPSIPCEDVDFDYTNMFVTPTPTPSNYLCNNVNMSFNICQYNEPTPTLTLTPTVTLTKTVDVAGKVTFTMLDETFSCVSVKVLVDCQTGVEYYTTDNLMFNGIPVITGITMNAVVNGNTVCVTYDSDSSTVSSNSNVTSITQLYSSCNSCNPLATNTPTPTLTPTPSVTQTSTPTATPTPTTTITPTPSVTSTITPTITPTISVTPTITPTTGLPPSQSPTSTPTVTPTVTQTPTSTTTSTPTPTLTPTNTQTPTMTSTVSPTPNYVYVYQSCVAIAPNVIPTQVIQSLPVPFALINESFKDVNGNCWQFIGVFSQTYIAPPSVISITYTGDYFATAYSTTYPTCNDCLTTPLCFDYLFENITSSSYGVTSIRPGLSVGAVCVGYTPNNTPVAVGNSVCLHSNVPLPGFVLNPTWADNHLPNPVYGVDYIITLNGC